MHLFDVPSIWGKSPSRPLEILWRKAPISKSSYLLPLAHKEAVFFEIIVSENATFLCEMEEVYTFMHDLKKEIIIFCVCENNENYTPTIITTSFWKQQISKSMFIGALRVIHYTMCCVRVLWMLCCCLY